VCVRERSPAGSLQGGARGPAGARLRYRERTAARGAVGGTGRAGHRARLRRFVLQDPEGLHAGRVFPFRDRRNAGTRLRKDTGRIRSRHPVGADAEGVGDLSQNNMNTTHRFDAIVVGSGMSGGWAAKELTEKGLKTLVLE